MKKDKTFEALLDAFRQGKEQVFLFKLARWSYLQRQALQSALQARQAKTAKKYTTFTTQMQAKKAFKLTRMKEV